MELDRLLTNAGFALTDTGGGIEQYLTSMPDGSYIIITNSEGEPPTSATEECTVGVYSPEGEAVRFEKCADLARALQIKA